MEERVGNKTDKENPMANNGKVKSGEKQAVQGKCRKGLSRHCAIHSNVFSSCHSHIDPFSFSTVLSIVLVPVPFLIFYS